MLNQTLLALTLTAALLPTTALATRPTNTQKCEAAVETASGKFAQCKLTAESAFAKSGNSGKLSGALAKCTSKLETAFANRCLVWTWMRRLPSCCSPN